MEVNHKDTNKLNNYFDNLEWRTHTGNMTHAEESGCFDRRKGELNENAKLTDQDVRNMLLIRALTGLSYRKIGKLFNVCPQLVWEIDKGKKWKHVSRNLNIV
jgi:hypothetical protein